MKLVITGHRKHKLETYDKEWIKEAICATLSDLLEDHGYIRGYSGMASGVDLWFCQSCCLLKIPYVACIPFDEQDQTMDSFDQTVRAMLIEDAVERRKVKNSWMVEEAEMGLVIWDGNKGGTHNVVQQLIEKRKPFIWINPVAQKIWPCI